MTVLKDLYAHNSVDVYPRRIELKCKETETFHFLFFTKRDIQMQAPTY